MQILLRLCPNLLSKSIIHKRWNCTIAADFDKNGYITNHNVRKARIPNILKKKIST